MTCTDFGSLSVTFCDWMPAPGDVGDRPVNAIGDIHGFSEHLDKLDDALSRDARQRGTTPETILMGDYIDRGPDPLGCLRAAGRVASRGGSVLLGNHDDFLRQTLVRARVPDSEHAIDDQTAQLWMMNGGANTLERLGGEVPDSLDDLVHQVDALVPEDVARTLLDDTLLTVRRGDAMFVHAGIDPRRPRDDQRIDDLLWIRDHFLLPASDPAAWAHFTNAPPFVVHGHTPGTRGVYGRRVGVDAGVFKTGVLCAVQLQGDRIRFVCVHPDTGEFPRAKAVIDDLANGAS